MKHLLSLILLGSTLFIFSCEKQTIVSNDQELTTEDREFACLIANKLEELEGDCCRYEICVDPNLLGNFVLTAGGPKISLDENNCAEITICGTTEVSLLDLNFNGGKPTNGCTITLTCHDREACCESICFDFAVDPQASGLCTEFVFSLDGDEACFPNGIPLFLTDGLIEFVSASSPQGNVEFLGIHVNDLGWVTNNWHFELCLDNLYQENIIEITFFEYYCETEITVSFDLLNPDAPNHRRCD